MKRYVFILTIVLMSGTICMAETYYLSINKDVRNDTGMDAHGIKMVLKGLGGQPEVLQHFDGFTDKNHFGSFESAVVDDTTVLWWSEPLGSNGQARPIPNDEWVHIGYRLNLPAEILETYWTDETGTRIGDIIGQPSQEVIRVVPGTFELRVTNNLRNGMPISFRIVGYASVGQEIPLAQLNSENPLFNNLTPVGAGGNTQLSSGMSESWTLSSDSDKPWIIYVKEGENPDNEVVFRDYGYYGPSELDPYIPRIPTVSEWGLIIMGLLLLVAGTVMIVRRKQRIAA